MDFTDEQRKRIDTLLAEGEEYNKQMRNITYSHEEVWKPIHELIDEMKKREQENVRNQI